MTDSSKIYIIGIGSDGLAGLTARAREILLAADLVLGSDHTLARLPEITAERYRIGHDLQEAVRLLETNRVAAGADRRRRMVIVASGDPLFYGVARYLCDRVGKEHFEILPHVSSMQLAFARIKESWEEAFLTNLATHALESVLDRIRTAETVGLFTTRTEDPPAIARTLLARGLDYFRAYICENLGAPDERVTQGELAEIQDMEFSSLNVMILKRKPGRPDQPRATGREGTRFRRFGNPDDVFAQSQPKSGLITQAEVRAICLAQLDIQPGMVVWDIGAGSGSVAIEAAQLADPGMVYAIEQNTADYPLIVANAQTFGVRNLQAIHGSAPDVFAGLPAPDAVFVGGTGHEVARLLEGAFQALRPGGRLVVNVATLESLTGTYSVLKSLAPPVHVLLINLARGTEQLETLRFEALNPTFVLSIHK
ncbi:MAG: precorrin-6y C5,15-methyltransferase (decarboxylating) subunit CbiE [Planctomycetes bacterium]|nr:precorrin-6y C5,15-methyltransferase (decarboxylating) subunit CbiE [Planctomycetota bacterium]